MPGVRHYLYAVHRSGAYLTPPSFAARVYLLLLRWIARDFESVFRMCATCAVDSPLTSEETQLWSLLADFDDDQEPEAHASHSLRRHACASSCGSRRAAAPS